MSKKVPYVLSKTVGKYNICGWVTRFEDGRFSAVVFVQDDDPVESRQQIFYRVDEAVVWVDEVVGEIAREASWSGL